MYTDRTLTLTHSIVVQRPPPPVGRGKLLFASVCSVTDRHRRHSSGNSGGGGGMTLSLWDMVNGAFIGDKNTKGFSCGKNYKTQYSTSPRNKIRGPPMFSKGAD